MRHARIDTVDPVSRTAALNIGLIGWWMLTPGHLTGPVYRDLVRRIPGTLTNMATPSTSVSGKNPTTRPGGYGEIRFDGTNDYVVVEENVARWTLGQYSIAAWVNVANFSDYNGIICRSLNANTRNYEMDIRATSGLVHVGHTKGGFQQAISTTAVIAGQWTHVAGTYDLVTHKVYVGGRLENTVTAGTPGVPDAGTALFLGCIDPSVNFFEGAIDDMRLYNRVLSSEEIGFLVLRSRAGYRQELRPRETGNLLSAAAAAVGGYRLIGRPVALAGHGGLVG